MATNRDIKKAVSKAGRTVGRSDNLTRALIKAGSNLQSRQSALKNVKTYKEYLDLSPETVSKLSRDELRSVVAKLNKIESKRLKNLEKYGYNTQAVRGIQDTGGKTKASKDMTRQQLLHEYKRAKSFLESETSTVSGARQFVSGIQDQLGADREPTTEEIRRAYDLLDKYKESGAVGFYKKGDKKSAGYTTSMATQRDIWDMMESGMSDDEILSNLGVMSRTDYEAMQDTSEEFTMFDHRP